MSGEPEPLWGSVHQDTHGLIRSTTSEAVTSLISKEALKSTLRSLLAGSAKRIADLLKEWDTDGSGDIDVGEFRQAVKSLGFAAGDDEIDEVFAELDADGSGSIEAAEISAMLQMSPEERKATKDASDSAWALALQRSVLLKQLGKNELKYVRQSMKTVSHAGLQTIYSQSDEADAAYWVVSGRYVATLQATNGARKLREYTAGMSFGSHEMLSSETRSCSVLCAEAGSLFVLSKRVFNDKIRIAASPSKALLEQIKSIPLFQHALLDLKHLTQLARAAEEHKFEADEVVCTQDSPAHHIFAVVSGECVATHATGTFTMMPPLAFGENALYAEEALRTRNATVTAGPSGCTLLSFPVSAIEALVGYLPQDIAVKRYNRKLLMSVKVGDKETPLCEGLAEEQLDWLVEAVVEEAHAGGTVLAVEGASDDRLQILKRGTASVTYSKGGNQPRTLLAGDFFGERSLVKEIKRKSSVTAGPPQLLTVSLSGKMIRNRAELAEWRERLASLLPVPTTTNSAKTATARTVTTSRGSSAIKAAGAAAGTANGIQRPASTQRRTSTAPATKSEAAAAAPAKENGTDTICVSGANASTSEMVTASATISGAGSTACAMKSKRGSTTVQSSADAKQGVKKSFMPPLPDANSPVGALDLPLPSGTITSSRLKASGKSQDSQSHRKTGSTPQASSTNAKSQESTRKAKNPLGGTKG